VMITARRRTAVRRASVGSSSSAHWLAPAAAVAISLAPAAVAGQTTTPVVVALRVVDSSGAPVGDVGVSVVRGLSSVLAHASTNAVGRAALTIVREGATLQLIARKIGYQPSFQFFTPLVADTLALTVTLSRAVTTLAPVHVNEREDLKRKSYHLDADEIAGSSLAMIDATDVFKLRRDMLTSRGGAQACAIPWTDHDGSIESVWVNGRRVVLPVVDSVYVAQRKPALGIAAAQPRPNPHLTPSALAPPPRRPAFTQFTHIDTVLSILRSIKAEHIAEITYHDCFDASLGKAHSEMAMFIALKPGIGYDESRGSYVVSDPALTRPGLRSALDTLPRYRFRVLGVYDGATGDALPGVAVIDTVTGARATTTATGTVSLFFLPPGTNPVRLHLTGYRDTTFNVSISPGDTVPVTFVLVRPPTFSPE
jgi:hypothetical protein